MKALKKYLILGFFLVWPWLVSAQIIGDGTRAEISRQDQAFLGKAGFTTGATIGSTVNIVLRGFLGLLGIIFLVLIIVAGFNWMTAGGDEAKVTKAKAGIQRSVIGLIIILASYGITFFIFNALDNLVQ